MNKETLLNYVYDPGKLNRDTLIELTELVNDFPYCQATRILLTLNLFKDKHFRYNAELKKTAVYVTDRRTLKKHIDALSQQNAVSVLPDEDVETLQEETVFAEREEIRVKEEEVPVEETDEESKVIADEPAIEIEERTIEDEQIDRRNEAVKERPVDKHKKTIDDLKRIVKERLAQIEKDKLREELPLKIGQPVDVEEVEPDKSVNELIDEFIKNEPRISRPQASFFNPVDAAKESIVDEENIVSETLAMIYFDQGRFEKAINIYRKLSLKYPEKSSYFAALIEKAVEELKK
jgi:tetratricopeptide (TPR) repeat protein